MARAGQRADNDVLVIRARSSAQALGRLYELYYERIFRFCVHRLFQREVAEDVTGSVFLTVARTIADFQGRTEQDFRHWIYAIAANQANAYLRKKIRRRRLLEQAMASRSDSVELEASEWPSMDWPRLYEALLELKPLHQTIVTLRFFEDMGYDQIAQITGAKQGAIRVTVHRILGKLRDRLQTDFGQDE